MAIKKNLPDQPGPACISLESGWVGSFLSTPNFDLWYFCSLLTYKDLQYLIWKIWFISIWRLKAKVMAWLLTWFIFAESTLISYHIEASVKIKVGCTALTSSNAFFVTDITLRLSCYRYAISISKTLNASFGSWTSITLRLAFYAFASSISGTLIYRIMNWKSMSFKHDFNPLKINGSNNLCANIIFSNKNIRLCRSHIRAVGTRGQRGQLPPHCC